MSNAEKLINGLEDLVQHVNGADTGGRTTVLSIDKDMPLNCQPCQRLQCPLECQHFDEYSAWEKRRGL